MKRKWQYLHGTGLLAQLTYLLLETYLAMVVDTESLTGGICSFLLPIPIRYHGISTDTDASIGTSLAIVCVIVIV